MKIKSLFVAVLLMGGVVVAPAANASEKPVINSFTFTPQQIDLQSTTTLVSFELIASHPIGIQNQQILVTLTNDKQQIGVNLLRTESPVNQRLTRVTFKGSVTLPRNIPTGVYALNVEAVTNSISAGYQFESDQVKILDFRTTVGAENGLLVSAGGYADLTYPTFAGPTFDDSTLGNFINRIKYSGSTLPIWKVGETIAISDFYELHVPTLELKVASTTPEICKPFGSELLLMAQGTCSYSVYTDRDQIYKQNIDSRTVTITPARTKPVMSIQDLDTQDFKIFPASITLPQVYASGTGWVLPQSATPQTCSVTAFVVKVFTSGSCVLTYQTEANSLYLASDSYKQKIEILKDGKPVVAPIPVATPTAVATPAPTPTAKPVVKRTITCTKGTKSVKRTGTAPKCPKGYKLKK
jgi:hypothetical protein